MSARQIVYEISLKDMLSGKLHQAEGAVNKFESSLHGAAGQAHNLVGSLLTAAGIGFSIGQMFDFAKSSRDEVEHLDESISQLKAGLQSTGGVAGVTFQGLQESAETLSKNLKFTKSQIMDMQSVLLTFPAVTKDTFNDASLAVLNISTRMKIDASEAAKQLGKALQDPVNSLGALHREGINVEELRKKFEHVHSTLARQKLIIQELGTEFAGSAAMAAQADPTFKWRKGIEQLKEKIGPLVIQIQTHLMPIFERVVNWIKGATDWIKNHKTLFEFLAVGIGGAVVALWGAVKATAALNAVMLLSPIGLIVAGIATVVAVVILCYEKFGKFRAVLWGVWEFLKSWANFLIMGPIKVIRSLGEMIEGVFTFSWKKIKAGAKDAAHVVFDGAKELATSFGRGYDEGMADFQKQQAKDKTTNAPGDLGLLGGKGGKLLTDGNGGGNNGTGKETSKATGNRPLTINIKADTLGVKEFKLMTTTITEAPRKIKELIAETIVSAVNDSMIIADR